MYSIQAKCLSFKYIFFKKKKFNFEWSIVAILFLVKAFLLEMSQSLATS